MPIIRVTKRQIQAANKAREAALSKNRQFRLHEERLELVRREVFRQKEHRDDVSRSHPTERDS